MTQSYIPINIATKFLSRSLTTRSRYNFSDISSNKTKICD